MNIGNAKLAFGASLKLFEDLIKGLHQHNAKLRKIDFQQEISILEKLKATIHAEVFINEPTLEFETQSASQQPIILFKIGGKVKPKITFAEKTSDTLFEIPFSASVKLQIVLRRLGPGLAPVLGLDYMGVKNVSAPLDDKFVDDLFNETEYVKLIEDFKLEIIEPVIAGLEAVYYADPLGVDNKPLPSHGSYPVILRHMPAQAGFLAGIGLFFGLPAQALNVANVSSFIPSGSELFVHVSEGMLQSMVDKFKTELQTWLHGFSSSLKVSKLSLTVENNAISVNGKIKETENDVTGTISGRFHFRHRPGLKKIILDGSEIDIDIDLPWWADMLLIIFFPVGIAVYSYIDIAEEKIPNIGQKILANMINNMFDKLENSINLDGLSFGGVPIEVYPDTIKLDNNALSIKVQVLIQPITETIVWADYGKILGKFMIFHLESGRQFYTDDLIRFMKKGLIITPGFHVLAGRYIRSNPDGTTGNNLKELWGR